MGRGAPVGAAGGIQRQGQWVLVCEVANTKPEI